MLKKICMVSMVVLMLAGVVFSVANFTAPNLDAAEIGGPIQLPLGAWSEMVEGQSWCFEHPLQQCVLSF